NSTWVVFEANRETVVQFVVNARLNQQNLDPDALQSIWLAQAPTVNWWQPAELQRETYFTGKTENRNLALVYNDVMQKGYLLVKAIETPNDKTKNSF
ncbi:MAG TPA: hypothetical protein PLM98_02395, partial [Thiolinea sp.]|nr:hypothetical protein [Thiolinea sp.]